MFILGFFEITYRYQLFDYYKAELTGLNIDLDVDKPNVLVFGDSFTAQSGSYLTHLRDSIKNYNFVNCAIPGTAAREAAYISGNRVAHYAPKKVIYQMYLGNDLLDESPPINWSELSFVRNWYWSFSKCFRVVGYFNYKFSQASSSLNSDFDESFQSKNMEEFSIEKYSPRCKMLVQANPNYLQQTYHLEDEMTSSFKTNLNYIQSIKESLPDCVEFQLVVIPHAVSVSKTYQGHFKQMGANFSSANQYPIFQKLRETFPNLINVTDELARAENANNAVYFSNDDHLNLEGHRITANVILDKIEW